MHRYTCAEASLQALLALWELPLNDFSWATAGYSGAILSGDTTCGLLIGSSIAINLRCGQGKASIPEDHEEDRQKAIQAVGELYTDFIKKFGSTQCKTLTQVDFSKGEELVDYIIHKKWKQTCDGFLNFAFRKCATMAKEGKI
ncbi:MAG: C-GCAxxG-C-C family protein [Candidatus Hodarchaeota archaeon]